MSTDQPAPPSIPPRRPAHGPEPEAAGSRPAGTAATAAPGGAPTSATGVPAQARTPLRTAPADDAGPGAGAPSAGRARAAAAGGAASAMAGRVLRGVTTAVTGTAPGAAGGAAPGAAGGAAPGAAGGAAPGAAGRAATGASGTPQDPTPTAPGAPPRSTDPEAHPTMATDTSTRPAPRATAAAPARDAAPRRVRLSLSRVDPWSVMKLSFLLSFAVGIMIVVAAAVIWMVLDGLAVFTTVNDMIREIVGEESPIDILQFVDFTRVVSGAMVIAIVDVILLTALSTIGAFLYNITAALVGGVNVTLTDE